LIRKGEWHLIRAMMNEGLSVSDIARRMGLDRKTVRKALRSESWPDDDSRARVARPSKLDPYKPFIEVRLESASLSAVRLFEEIRGQGYNGRMTILKEFVHSVKEQERLRAVVRFETVPGEQSQVDWAHAGNLLVDGERRGVYAFVMVLGYSRMRFVTFTHSMDIHTLMRCHIEAFRYFGGHTREILYDNMKTVIDRPKSVDLPAALNREFADFAGYYGFRVDSCWPYRAQTKGKSERLVGYVKDNFLLGREFESLEQMRREGLAWCDDVNARVHGTTGKIPREELAKEGLIPLAGRDYDAAKTTIRIVARDCLVSYEANRYSVPWRLAGRSVVVRDAADGWLRVFLRDELVAEHEKARGKHQVIINPEHLVGLLERVIGGQRKARMVERAAPVQSPRLVLFGREMPLVSVESRELSYYEEVAG
jgi:transposase